MLNQLRKLHSQLTLARQGNCYRCRCFHNDVLAEVIPIVLQSNDPEVQVIGSQFLAWQHDAQTRQDEMVG